MRFLVAILLFYWLNSQQLLACASCGSGGNSPLFLYPNETLKFHIGLTQTNSFRNISKEGEALRVNSSDTKRTLLIAGGYRFLRKAYLTISAPWINNLKGSDERTNLGDPLFTVNYFLQLANFSSPQIPQWKASVAYKPSGARGIQQSSDEHQLDVFGTGFEEWTLGTDLWWGLSKWKFGLAHTETFAKQRTFSGVTIDNGRKAQSIITIGRDHPFTGKVISGLVHDYQATKSINGETQDGSDFSNLTIFLTYDQKWSQEALFRLTYNKRGISSFNSNGFAQDSLTVALQYILI